MPTVSNLVETAPFVEDIDRAVDFYERVLALEAVRHDERGAVFRVGIRQVLLLVSTDATREPKVTPGGVIPPCGASGSLHVAFGIAAEDLEAWEAELGAAGIETSRVAWESAGESLCCRDPDGHLIELLTDVEGLWGLGPEAL